MKKRDLNYFFEGEKVVAQKFQQLRDRMLLPILKLLKKLDVSANFISYAGLFLLTGFVYYASVKPVIASLFLISHIVLDGLDGPLARYNKRNGASGAFTDIICDHTGMAVVVLTLIGTGLVNPLIASTYIYAYTILVIFLIIRNKLGVPAKFAIRTKYYVYGLFFVYVVWSVNYFNTGLIVFLITMVPQVIISYSVIKRTV